MLSLSFSLSADRTLPIARFRARESRHTAPREFYRIYGETRLSGKVVARAGGREGGRGATPVAINKPMRKGKNWVISGHLFCQGDISPDTMPACDANKNRSIIGRGLFNAPSHRPFLSPTPPLSRFIFPHAGWKRKRVVVVRNDHPWLFTNFEFTRVSNAPRASTA